MVRSTCDSNPFSLDDGVFRAGAMRRLLNPVLDRVLQFPRFRGIYAAVQRLPLSTPFAERSLHELGVDWEPTPEQLERIPESGPLLVVANHPFGGIEGLILTSLLLRRRPDAKVLANFVLGRIPELRECMIFVDPFGGPNAARRNVRPLRDATAWLMGGHALGVFPAGEVARLDLRERCVLDGPWSKMIGRLVHRTGCAVLPVHFDGQNSAVFHLLGALHARLGTALLPRELLNKQGSRIEYAVGTAIPFDRLNRIADPCTLVEYLRMRTSLLAGRRSPPRRGRPVRQSLIAEPVSGERVAAELEALPRDALLLESGDFQIWCARSGGVPTVLRELGRLRELTFRGVGEGTGRAIDLDRFDDYYEHLLLWNRRRRELAGAYRIGATDEIVERFGERGLYTNTLFRFDRRLLDRLGPALELGRSFVVPKYQNEYAPLMLLWRGIGRLLAVRPRYRRLFGAVSISASYQTMTRRLLVAFLRCNRFDAELAELASPRRPPRWASSPLLPESLWPTVVSDIDEVDQLVREIERGRRGMPILLRQYLRLNARLLGFSVDPRFGHVIDGLIVVDVASVDRAILKRFMGSDASEAFLAHHAAIDQSATGSTRRRA
mgnify:CR=1 FL=1